tara:strand:- start:1534 stop:3096 length:1563 start_codon:yes stop_codon:yes gene_type:complete
MWAALGKAAVGMAKKKVKKKGAEMAKNIVNKKEKDNSSAIVVREKSASIVQSPGGALVNQDQDSSIQKPKSGSSPLDRIDSALLDIMNTLKSRRKLMLAQSRKDRVQSNKEKKAKREGLLEKMKAGGKKMLGTVKAAATGWWERLQRFLLMTLLGGLVLAIKNNWESIQEKIEKVVKFVQDFWKFMEPVVSPLIQGLSWVVKQWTEMGSELMKSSKDNKEIGKETDQLSEDLKALEKTKKDVDGNFKEAEQGVKDKRNQKFDDLAKETGLDSGVSPDNEEQPETSREQVEQEVENKIDDSGIQSKLDGFKGKIEEVNVQPVQVDTSKMKKYETGASPVPETGPAIVHKGEVIIPAPVVKQVGGPMKIENILNMMQSSTTNIKQNPLSVISMMEGMSKKIAPMGEQLPGIINEKIVESEFENLSTKIIEKMEKTSSIFNDQEIVEKTFSNKTIAEGMKNVINTINEQTDYENPSSNTIIVPLPAPPQPSSGGGSGGETKVITVQGNTLNRYMETLIQGALY